MNTLFESKNVRKNRLKAERLAAFMKKQDELDKHRRENPTIEDRLDLIEVWIMSRDEGFKP